MRSQTVIRGFSESLRVVDARVGIALISLAKDMTPLDTPILFLATANADRSRAFYQKKLGLEFVTDDPVALVFRVGASMLRIQKVERVQAAPYTALGWAVADVRQLVEELRAAGVEFLRYEGMAQDENGIWDAPGGASVAWLKDPDGNVLSLTQMSCLDA